MPPRAARFRKSASGSPLHRDFTHVEGRLRAVHVPRRKGLKAGIRCGRLQGQQRGQYPNFARYRSNGSLLSEPDARL